MPPGCWDIPMEVNMPASSGALLDWKPTGPAETWGGLELWGWHVLQGHPSKARTVGPS